MFLEQLSAAVEAAETPSQIYQLERAIWQQAWANRHIGGDDANRLTEKLHAKKRLRAELRRAGLPHTPIAPFCKPRMGRIKGPKKVAAIARRRYLASCWPLPPDQASNYSTCEQSALRIVADEIKTHGVSMLCHAAVAARAGTSVSVVKNMYRKARADGLLMREERRRRGQNSLTNIMRPRCPRWTKWIRKHAHGCRPPGVRNVKNLTSTDYRFRKDGASRAVESFKQAAETAERVLKKGVAPNGATKSLPT